MPSRPILADSNHGPRLSLIGETVRVLATSDDTDGSFEIFETTAERNGGQPPHSNPWSESYVIAEGEMDVVVGGETMRATPGSFVNIPAGTIHSYRITSDRARFVVITTPRGASEFFHDVSRDPSKILEVARRHGLTVR
jgi:quercetin dioxygenase-like cupin family protein